jgi:hypothetical protein
MPADPIQLTDALEALSIELGHDKTLLLLHQATELMRNRGGVMLLPAQPSLHLMQAGWGICGTDLSPMEPCSTKIQKAQGKYAALLSSAHDHHFAGRSTPNLAAG